MWSQIDNRINRALGRVRQAFRGVLTRVNSTGATQTVQGKALASEGLQDNELFQHYGFTSNPLPGTMAVVLPINGRTSHGIIIATENGKYRLKGLASGEVALYDDLGQSITLTRKGIVVDGAGMQITVTNAPKARFEMDIEATGEIKDRCDSDGKKMSEMRVTYNGHNHKENGDGGGTTDSPNQEM